MPRLFDIEGDDLDQGYMNLREGQYQCGREMVQFCETLWERFEPYADRNFRNEFARNPDARFWELWLGNYLLEQGLSLLREDQMKNRQNGGPDFCVQHENHKVWIEAIAPTQGNDENEDRIPDLIAPNPNGREIQVGKLQARQENLVLLRITSALRTKKVKFVRYRANGIISPEDKCIIAINGAHFALQANDQHIPDAYKAVYPLGDLQCIIDRQTRQVVRWEYQFEQHIPRQGREAIDRRAFLDENYTQISGMIWSRISLGNYNTDARGIHYIHNLNADLPLEQQYVAWSKEFLTERNNGQLSVSEIAQNGD